MDKKIERQLKEEWNSWGKEKPWYCPECGILLNKEMFDGCSGGSGLYKPTVGFVPYHDWINAGTAVSFEQFCNVAYKWHKAKK